ncbi:MAG: hypothetical protein HXX13_04045 [Bacteroidetes bacterium]|nr:hypothetical protein [Bacteroidota bacterium]
MKRSNTQVLASLIISLLISLPFANYTFAQPQISPPPGLTNSGHASSSAEHAPSAPVGEGIFVLVTLGIALSIRKLSKFKRKVTRQN